MKSQSYIFNKNINNSSKLSLDFSKNLLRERNFYRNINNRLKISLDISKNLLRKRNSYRTINNSLKISLYISKNLLRKINSYSTFNNSLKLSLSKLLCVSKNRFIQSTVLINNSLISHRIFESYCRVSNNFHREI